MISWSPRKKKIIIISGLCLLIIFYFFWNCLPRPLFTQPFSPILLGQGGQLLSARIAADQQWRFPMVNRLPEKYKKALTLFEDRRFFYHPGVDPVALVRALYLNIKAGKTVSGGSTLTMQVIRIARKNRQRTYLEKLKEIIMALRLELTYSKDGILSLYAAHAPFGGNIVGLEAASRFYFGRSAAELSWAESALLAVLPNSPALVHPGRNRDALKKKRDALLAELHRKAIIDDLEFSLAVVEPLPGLPHPLPRLAPHLLDTLVARGSLDAVDTKIAADKQLPFYRTAISKSLQERVSRVSEEYAADLRTKGIHNAAVIVIANRSAEVLAYIGNTGLEREKERGQQVDIIQARRSTGSILKPLLYAAMLKSGEITPLSLVADIPTQYGGFMPDNFDRQYRGAVPAKEALAQSLNIPAVRMLKNYGIDRFYDFLKKCGLTTLDRTAADYGLTLVLGGAEGKLYDIAMVYSCLARVAQSGLPAGNLSLPRQWPIGPGEAYLTIEALEEVARPGIEGYWKNFSSSLQLAWKTGTSYGLRDAWAIGVTPRYTVGVWVGNADGEGNPALTGVSVAAPLMFAVYNLLDAGEWFQPPWFALKKITVCKLSGYIAADLCEAQEIMVPIDSHFQDICPYHHLVHLDRQGFFRVDSRCEQVENMTHRAWFTLPPVMEFYYERYHPGYRKLPPWRRDCEQVGLENLSSGIMNLLYPTPGTSVYIPVDLDGSRSEVIFKAVHRDPQAFIFWHIDENYIGQTRDFHHMGVSPAPGAHVLILVDDKGNRLERRFRVIGKDGK